MKQLRRISVSLCSVFFALTLLAACGRHDATPSSSDITGNVTYDFSRLEGMGAVQQNAPAPKGVEFALNIPVPQADAVYQASEALLKQAEKVVAGQAEAQTLVPLRTALRNATTPVLTAVQNQVQAKVDVRNTNVTIAYAPTGMLILFTKRVNGEVKLLAAAVIDYKEFAGGKVTKIEASGLDATR